jgi:hypothetical protein
MFMASKGEKTIGQNDVMTIVLDYLESNLMANISELWLLSGGCQGKNKNCIMLRFTLSLAIH